MSCFPPTQPHHLNRDVSENSQLDIGRGMREICLWLMWNLSGEVFVWVGRRSIVSSSDFGRYQKKEQARYSWQHREDEC